MLYYNILNNKFIRLKKIFNVKFLLKNVKANNKKKLLSNFAVVNKFTSLLLKKPM